MSVELIAREGGTQLNLTHALHPDWADYVDRTKAGWALMLDALAATFD